MLGRDGGPRPVDQKDHPDEDAKYRKYHRDDDQENQNYDGCTHTNDLDFDLSDLWSGHRGST